MEKIYGIERAENLAIFKTYSSIWNIYAVSDFNGSLVISQFNTLFSVEKKLRENVSKNLTERIQPLKLCSITRYITVHNES